tara:strand:- start:495 stop:719 length:225 start_codon:yes stop_codon:yes gene_type:complete
MKPEEAFMTYEQIGNALGLSRQSVQLIEKQALNKLRIMLAHRQADLFSDRESRSFAERLMPYIEAQEYYDKDEM